MSTQKTTDKVEDIGKFLVGGRECQFASHDEVLGS